MTTRQTGYQYIERVPGVVGGEPIIKGTGVSVRSIVILYSQYGSVARVLRAYPHVTRAAAEDALAYYDANREEIDRYIEENEAIAYGRSTDDD